MKTKYKFILVALPLAIISFLLSRVIWPEPIGMIGPEASLIPHFIFLSALESISFGIGVAFAIFGWMKVRASLMAQSKLNIAAFVSATWFLVSWWPHDNMHRVHAVNDFAGLLRIEYLFHFTLIIAGGIVALFLWRQISNNN